MKSESVKVIFFEAGITGGSVNRLLNLLKRWDFVELPCALITFFKKRKSEQLLKVDGPVWKRTFDFQGDRQPEIFTRKFGLVLLTWHAVSYFLKAIRIFTLNPNALIYINNNPYAHLPIIFAAFIMRRKVTCHLRSMNLVTKIEKLLIPAVTRFVVLTGAAKEHYIKHGIPEDRIKLIYDSIDLSSFSQTSLTARDNTIQKTVVVGSLFFLKGQDICIKALKLVREECPDMQLTLVGDGFYENDLRQLACSLGLENWVAFYGYSERIPEILAEFDIGILMSRSESGTPNCIHEYMAAGLPVIVSDFPGIRELVDDGNSGFIVPQESPEKLAERWIELVKNEDLRNRMGNRGKQIVGEERFNPKTEMRQIVDVIHSCWRT